MTYYVPSFLTISRTRVEFHSCLAAWTHKAEFLNLGAPYSSHWENIHVLWESTPDIFHPIYFTALQPLITSPQNHCGSFHCQQEGSGSLVHKGWCMVYSLNWVVRLPHLQDVVIISVSPMFELWCTQSTVELQLFLSHKLSSFGICISAG